MLSKLLAGLLLFSLSACSLYEGPAAAKKKNMSKLGCLNGLRTKLTDYQEGRATSADVQSLADCSVEAIHTFETYTKGESRDSFTAEEIRNFIQRFFLDDITISDSLLREFMRLKQTFVGGKATGFTRDDLKTAVHFIETAHIALVRLQPFMPITVNRMQNADDASIDAASKAFIEVAEFLGSKMVENQSAYSFPELARFCDELMKVFAGAGILEPVSENIDLIGHLKEIAISPYRKRDDVSASEWRLILNDGARWITLYAKFRNMNARYPDWTRGEGQQRLAILSKEAFLILSDVIGRYCPEKDRKADGCLSVPGIPLKSIAALLNEIELDPKLLGDVKKETLGRLISPIVKHLLAGKDLSVEGRNTDRFTLRHLQRLGEIFTGWMDASHYLQGVYARAFGNENFPNSYEIPTAAFQSAEPIWILGGARSEALETATLLRSQYLKTFALMTPTSRGVIFDGKNSLRPRAFRELARYTWLLPIFRRIVDGYVRAEKAKILPRKSTIQGITVEEFTTFIADFWPILVDLKLVGPRNFPESDAKKRFREAALFTQVSDGDSLISVGEGMQLVLYMLSVDPLSKETHRRATRWCGAGPADDYGKPLVAPECYRDLIYNFSLKQIETADLWAQFPLLTRFYDGLNVDRQAEFRKYVEEASRKTGYDADTWFGSDDTQATVMMFHYSESLFMKTDLNGDGFINRQEAANAFPIFRNVLAEMSGFKPNDTKLESVFYWVLAHGLPPVGDDHRWWARTWSTGRFLWWHQMKPDFKADRLTLMKVFATLSKPVAPTFPE